MNLPEIDAFLEQPSPQTRMQATAELRRHDADVIVPLLKQRMTHSNFACRSFVAMALGEQRTEEGFAALLGMVESETDPNVIAEAANALAKFGSPALPHLVTIFEQTEHWLVRQSLFASLEPFDCSEQLLHLCRLGIAGKELTVVYAAIANLGRLRDTPQAPEALAILLQTVKSEYGFIRSMTARQLRYFGGAEAEAALASLSQDGDHRVVGTVLEGLLPPSADSDSL